MRELGRIAIEFVVFDLIDRGRYTGKHARMRYDQCRAEKAYTVYDCTVDDAREALRNGAAH